MSHTRAAKKTRQRGFSVVELMIAMALSLILLGGVLAVVYSSKVTYMENERVGRLQENGRAAMEFILRDLRGAGFPGCAQPIPGLFQTNNNLNSNTDLLWNLTQPVFGYEAVGAAWNAALGVVLDPAASAGSDILVVRTVPTGAPVFRAAALVSPTDAISVRQDDVSETVAVGQTMVVSDCGGATVFAATAFTPAGAGMYQIEHTTSAAVPGNSTNSLQASFLTPGATVAPIVTIIYYVAPSQTLSASGQPVPALWRQVSNGAATEMIQGVQMLQIKYGEDTNGDLLVDTYRNANDVANWANVISVSVAMLVRSVDANSQIPDTRTYRLFDVPFGPAITAGPFNDRYQRTVFATTATLRNRTP